MCTECVCVCVLFCIATDNWLGSCVQNVCTCVFCFALLLATDFIFGNWSSFLCSVFWIKQSYPQFVLLYEELRRLCSLPWLLDCTYLPAHVVTSTHRLMNWHRLSQFWKWKKRLSYEGHRDEAEIVLVNATKCLISCGCTASSEYLFIYLFVVSLTNSSASPSLELRTYGQLVNYEIRGLPR